MSTYWAFSSTSTIGLGTHSRSSLITRSKAGCRTGALFELAEGGSFQLRVQIDLSPDLPQTITIYDNAAGIDSGNFQRAFKTAQPPLDRSGLSEFGVGMKSAAFWFAPRWEVRTSALGESVERSIAFDINDIIDQNLERLAVNEKPCAPSAHFTELRLRDLHHPLAGRTVGKIKSHLSSMYRRFTAQGLLNLEYNGSPLTYEDPPILEAAPYNDRDASRVVWRKDIDFDLGDGMTARGFAALRSTASTSEAGFALFRRNRLIQGSADEAYRPAVVFGSSNKYTYQRLFGELELTGFEVTHTKDGFQWDENEAAFLDLLKDHLKAAPINLLAQAEGYRVRADARSRAIRDSLDAASESLSALHIEGAERTARETKNEPERPEEPAATILDPVTVRELTFRLDQRLWRVRLHLDDRENPRELFSLHADEPTPQEAAERITGALVRVYLNHPFIQQAVTGPDMALLTPILRMLAAFCVAELIASATGIQFAGAIRRATNHLLSPHNQLASGD